jgi:hypothetical protein
MGVLDRVRRTERQSQKAQTEVESPTGNSGSSLVVAEPPVIKRLKGVIWTLQTFVAENGSDGIGKMSFLFSTMADELADEMSEYDETQMMFFLARIGQIIEWVGHGQTDVLPDDLKPFAESIQPTVTKARPEPEDAAEFNRQVAETVLDIPGEQLSA